ncbi:hypothetical protein LINGRAHAP2_LOCUS7750 [Linum grandiflorum]
MPLLFPMKETTVPPDNVSEQAYSVAVEYPTFRDTLLKQSRTALIPSQFDVDETTQAQIETSIMDGDPLKRMVRFPFELRKQWSKEYRGAIILKMLAMVSMSLSAAIGKRQILSNGPYSVAGAFVMLKQWCSQFVTKQAVMSSLITWIRTEGLPFEYYHDDSLFAIASQVGAPIRTDRQTTMVSRGKFAWLCVEIDLSKPLPSEVWVDGEWLKVAYEGIPTICRLCWHAGHATDSCNLKVATEAMDSNPATDLVTGRNSMVQEEGHMEEEEEEARNTMDSEDHPTPVPGMEENNCVVRVEETRDNQRGRPVDDLADDFPTNAELLADDPSRADDGIYDFPTALTSQTPRTMEIEPTRTGHSLDTSKHSSSVCNNQPTTPHHGDGLPKKGALAAASSTDSITTP